MRTWKVQILCQIGKTIEVEADDEEQASELAHELFDPTSYDGDEYYSQETYHMEEVTNE